MSTITKAIAAVEFQANSRQANAALESIRESAQDCRTQVEKLQADLAKGITMTVVDGKNVDIEKRIKQLQNMAKAYDQAGNSLVKGVKAFDELWKNAKLGTIENMTAAQIRAGMNGSKRVQDNLKLMGPEDRLKSDAIQQMNDEAQKILDKMKLHTDGIIGQLERGEVVAKDVLVREQKGLEALLDQLKQGSEEWQKYHTQLVQIKKGVDDLSVSEKQLRGEIVTREDAIRVATQSDKKATQDSIDNAQKRIEAAQEVIDKEREEIKTHQEKADAAQAELVKTRELKAGAQKELTEARSRTEEEKRLARERLAQAKTDKEAAVNNTKEQQRIYNELDGEVKTLTSDIETLQKKLGLVNEPQATNESTAATKKKTEANKEAALSDEERARLTQQLEEKRGLLAKKTGELATQEGVLKKAQDDEKTATDNASKALRDKNELYTSTKNHVDGLEASVGALEATEEGHLSTMVKENKVIADKTAEIDKQKNVQVMAQNEIDQAQQNSIEKKEEAIRVLEKLNREINDPGNAEWQENEKYIGQLKQEIEDLRQKSSELRGEMMSLEEAQTFASKAGKDDFIATAQQLQQAQQAMERYRESLIKTIQQKQRDGDVTDKEEQELAELEQQMKDLKFEQDNFNMSHKKMQNLLSEPTKATDLDELKAAIKRADGELHRMQNSLGENSKEYQAFAEQVKNAKNVLKDMEGQAKATASAWDKAWSRLKTYVGMYMGFNIVWSKFTATGGDLLTLSDKMGEVRKTTGFTADEVGRLSDNLAKLDTRTGLTGLMEFSSLAGSIGLKTQEQVEGFTEAANMLAVSLPEMGNEASRTLMKIADATGDLEKNGGNVRETLERVGSTIIALRANSAAAAGPITDFVSRVGAVGAQAGISIDQIAALGATVDALGGRVEMSATALSRMIPAIRNNTFEVAKAIGMTEKELKGKTAMEQMVAIFKSLRDSAKGFDTSTEEGMNAMADSVEKALGRSTSMQEVMKELNQQGARAGIVFGLLSQNVDKLEEQLETAGEAYSKNTALMDEYNKMNDTTAAKWAKLKNQFEEFWVGDKTQRWLGSLIDGLRKLIDLITEEGPLGKALRYLTIYYFMFKGAWTEAIGKGIIWMGKFILSLRESTVATEADTAAKIQNYTVTTSLGTATEEVTQKTNLFAKAWGKMNATMKANVIAAVAGLLIYLGSLLLDARDKANEAAAELGRFNQKLADEKKALDNLFTPLKNSNLAQEERSKLISEINSKYSKYLGYMLSETTSAIQLAEAHALIAKRIREEAYEKRILAQEDSIREKYDTKINSAYAGITKAVQGGAKGDADVQGVADYLKGLIDKNIDKVTNVREVGDIGGGRIFDLDPTFRKQLAGALDRLVSDGKISQKSVSLINGALSNYILQAKDQHDEMMDATQGSRADLRNMQRTIKGDVNTNLNRLTDNLKNFGVKTTNGVPSSIVRPEPSIMEQSADQKFGASHDWTGNSNVQANTQIPLPSWKPEINKKNIEEVKQFVEAQDQLRGFLKANAKNIAEDARKTAEMYLISETEMAELRKLLPAEAGGGGSGGNGGGGSGGTNPYGTYDRVKDAYEKWDADSLVARRKEMLERVRALANGADVQKVLSEDAKFISEATRKNIKDTKQAIEWYNTERLKIQEALHGKHLTNTGDWMDPPKQKARKKMLHDETRTYLDELDAYYTERKAKIQEAAVEEGISEAEVKNRTLANEAEWRQRRMELQKMYGEKAKDVTEEEQEAIFEIIATRTGDDVKMVKAMYQSTLNFVKQIEKMNEQGAKEAHEFRAKMDKQAMQDFNREQAAIHQQMKAIQDIIDKERPFNGITKNLRENLVTMGILTADMTAERNKLMKENADMTDFNARQAEAELKRTAFILGEAENAWTTSVEEIMQRMADAGMTAWADEIRKSPKMQEALMAQLHNTYDQIQEAIKKEASLMKKQAENMWNNILLPGGDGKTTMKDAFEKAIAQLGLDQGRVSRANSLIGAGPASERVADKLAIKQMQLQLTMQTHYFNLMKKQGKQRVDDLTRQIALAKEEEDIEKAKRLEQDKQHVIMSLRLATTKEQTTLLKQQEEIIAKTEESQNRLYKELKEWADLLASSMQSLFEASNAGNAEYYNERARIALEGEEKDDDGNVKVGKYVIIENAGTSDAEAHYEELTELQKIEREREIEQQNAQAEAWKKVMDDINMKMSETITDHINAMLQDAAVYANTDATKLNTEAIEGLTEKLGQNTEQAAKSGIVAAGAQGQPSVVVVDSGSEKDKDKNKGKVEVEEPTVVGVDNGQGFPAAQGGTAEGGTIPVAPWPMTEEQKEQSKGYMQELWNAYIEQGVVAEQSMGEQVAEIPNAVLPPWQITEEGLEVATERMAQLWQVYAEQGIAAMQQMSDAMDQLPNKIPDVTFLTQDNVDAALQNATTLYEGQAQIQMDASNKATDTVVSNEKKQGKVTSDTNNQNLRSTNTTMAKMTLATQLYGLAYQTMSNDNLNATQKFLMFAVQAAGQAAISMLTTNMAQEEADSKVKLPGIFGKAVEGLGPIAGPIAFAAMTALLGGLMGMAVSAVSKGKSQIAQATGASTSSNAKSISAGKLMTGMLTYGEGNVNEFTDPSSLTPGRSYNVDSADGKTYRAKYMGVGAKTHLTNGPEFHLVGERGREAIIDAHTTRLMQMDDTGIWQAIQTLYNGGSLRHSVMRRKGRGMAAFADGNIDEFETMADGGGLMAGGAGFSPEQMMALQASIDRQSDLLERAMTDGIHAYFDVYGRGGLIDSYDTGKKTVTSHGERY